MTNSLAVIASGGFDPFVEWQAGGSGGSLVGDVLGGVFVRWRGGRVGNVESGGKAGAIVASSVPFSAGTEVAVAIFEVAEEIGELRSS